VVSSRPTLAAFVTLSSIALASAGALGAETDPHYAWLRPPSDSTRLIDAMINDRLQFGLREVNRGANATSLSCRDAAARMTSPLQDTAMHFVFGGTRSWGISTAPASSTEYADELRHISSYRYALLFPFGSLVPLDPAVRVGDILFGTDKLGHFFTNGLRYFDRYLAVRASGQSEAEAVRAAVILGVLEESSFLGLGVSGIFSYADLHANDRGLRFFRELCSGPTPELRVVEGRWTLRRPFSIARYVDPCWDESWNTSAFSTLEGDAVRRAIEELCPRWSTPRVIERRAVYRRQVCHSRSRPILDELLRDGLVPDPSPWSIDAICAASKKPPSFASKSQDP
jgi:hypothetical protein